MRKLFVLLLFVSLTAACGGGGNGGITGNVGGGDCSVGSQKLTLLQAMRDWYLWNANLPADVDVNQFVSPEELLAFLTTFSPSDGMGNPVDRFSFIDSAAADQQFFGEGRYEGYGFVRVAVAPGDTRLARVFADSPAGRAGFERGQRILELNGRTIAEIEAAEGVNAVLATSPVNFLMRRPDDSEFSVSMGRDIVTIDPVPQFRVIDDGMNPPVGYMELVTFITPAEPEFETAFAAFSAAGVNDVIIDVRWNGGGLLSTTELLADYLGGLVAQNLVFTNTEFNADRAAANNDTSFFNLRGNSINLSRMVVVTNRGSASASELIANGLEPHVDVTLVGDSTFGKPVGQVGLQYCDRILRPASFRLTNADGFGDYFDGLPADCAVTPDYSIPIGADNDPHIVAATTLLNTGACPVVAAPPGMNKFDAPDRGKPEDRSRPEREFLNAD
ncbi:MAG: S41 family peptidase [Woeseiaceae bacterium]|nr:S41 family peptidase [Woeseiaceae bacterium]